MSSSTGRRPQRRSSDDGPSGLRSQVRKVFRRMLPPIIHAIDVRDGNLRQHFFRHAFEAADIDAIHLSDRRFVADPERSDPAYLAEEVLVSGEPNAVLSGTSKRSLQRARSNQSCDCYLRPDRNAHTHKPPATAVATQESHTGTSNPATCTGHWFRARTAWNTAITPKTTPETTTYLLGILGPIQCYHRAMCLRIVMLVGHRDGNLADIDAVAPQLSGAPLPARPLEVGRRAH